jgi:hypothetical protein
VIFLDAPIRLVRHADRYDDTLRAPLILDRDEAVRDLATTQPVRPLPNQALARVDPKQEGLPAGQPFHCISSTADVTVRFRLFTLSNSQRSAGPAQGPRALKLPTYFSLMFIRTNPNTPKPTHSRHAMVRGFRNMPVVAHIAQIQKS